GSDHHVLFYLYPSALWQPGDIIPDWHAVTLPDNLPDGIYRWGAGAYVAPSQSRLLVTPPPGDHGPQLADLWLWDAIRFPEAQVASPLPADAIPLDATLGKSIALQGYQLIQRDLTWTLTLYWRAIDRPDGDYIVFVHGQREGQIVVQRDEKPLAGALPTWAWQPGELVMTTYSLSVSPDSLPDSIYVGMYSYPSLERLPVIQGKVNSDSAR